MRDGPEPLLQRRHALVRHLRSHDVCDAHDLRRDVEVVHFGFSPGDEWAPVDRGGKHHDNEPLDVVPEGGGGS